MKKWFGWESLWESEQLAVSVGESLKSFGFGCKARNKGILGESKSVGGESWEKDLSE